MPSKILDINVRSFFQWMWHLVEILRTAGVFKSAVQRIFSVEHRKTNIIKSNDLHRNRCIAIRHLDLATEKRFEIKRDNEALALVLRHCISPYEA